MFDGYGKLLETMKNTNSTLENIKNIKIEKPKPE
jgi:hypothetical protein